ncbi:MAG: OmpA family protein [Desulfofustis sp.]|nr:OmpA family protein [Desulfofustis sp.]
MKQPIARILVVAAVLALFTVLSGGCSKKSVMPPTAESGGMASSGKDINYPESEGYSENNLAAEGTLNDTNVSHLGGMAISGGQNGEGSEAYKRQHGRSSNGLSPVYFDFDQATIRADMSDRMIQNADFLKQISNPVIIEGNCDDRGTKEYNLALGEKRAINARDYLVNLGLNPARIRTVSYGEERPLFDEQTESAWSQNRRADFVIK